MVRHRTRHPIANAENAKLIGMALVVALAQWQEHRGTQETVESQRQRTRLRMGALEARVDTLTAQRRRDSLAVVILKHRLARVERRGDSGKPLADSARVGLYATDYGPEPWEEARRGTFLKSLGRLLPWRHHD